MNKKDILNGRYYTDGKMGVRQVMVIRSDVRTRGLNPAATGLRYLTVSAAKATDVGAESTMEVASFATWAKRELSEQAAFDFALQVAGKRAATRLTQPQRDLFLSVHNEATHKDLVEFPRSFTRVFKACVEKGLFALCPASNSDSHIAANLTNLGGAVLVAVHGSE